MAGTMAGSFTSNGPVPWIENDTEMNNIYRDLELGTVLTLFKRIDETTVLATRGAQSVTTGANAPLPGNQDFSASIWPPRP